MRICMVSVNPISKLRARDLLGVLGEGLHLELGIVDLGEQCLKALLLGGDLLLLRGSAEAESGSVGTCQSAHACERDSSV